MPDVDGAGRAELLYTLKVNLHLEGVFLFQRSISHGRSDGRTALRTHLELAILVFPFGARGNRFCCIPVRHKLAIDNAEEIIKGAVDAILETFTDTKHETPFCEQAMNSVVFYLAFVVGVPFG